ncbi:MAG: bacterial transcriptional activator domain-containing protein [Anaerolineae bacterium]|nr:bacterial transcriptional activator domain-containing protein [Anaerolineae bacterium]
MVKETYYYTLEGSNLTLSSFLQSIIDKTQDISPKFGKQTLQALATKNVSPQDLADTLIADLAKAKPTPRFFIIDNFDLLQPTDDVNEFFYYFAEKLPKGLQFVLNSRNLAIEPWHSLARSERAVVLADDQSLDGGIFDPEKAQTPHLEVYGLSGSTVYVNGLPLTTWDGPLPKHLFYYFVDHPMVTRDEIFETFWPDLSIKEATNVFHVTKRKISERLGFELTSYSGGFYRPSGQMSVHYDVHNFEELLAAGTSDDEEKPVIPNEWYDAIKLYRTPFLSGFDMPWIERRRQQLKQAYVGALIGIGRMHKAVGQHDDAISFYLRALREVPEREDVHRELMGLYTAQGLRDKAEEQYRMLKLILRRTLDISPSKMTRTFYKTLLGKDPE